MQNAGSPLLQWIEVVSKAAAIVGGLVVATLAVIQARLALVQRKRELRWKRAEKGLDVVEALFDYPAAKLACRILEPGQRPVKLGDQPEQLLAIEEVFVALDPSRQTFSTEQISIQEAFDALFYYCDRIEQLIRSELVDFTDVNSPLGYYVTQLSRHKGMYQRYISHIGNQNVLAFLARFEVWRAADTNSTVLPSGSDSKRVNLMTVGRGDGSSS